MKKIFTFFFGLIAALGTQAQSDFPLQFADKNGNIFEDGTVLNLTEVEDDGFGSIQMPSTLFVKNISDTNIEGGGTYEINKLDNGAFQTCFPVNCTQKRETGEWETGHANFTAGQLKDMETEWFPDEEATSGNCVVTYQLVTYKQNPLKPAEWAIAKYGPTIKLNFTYSDPASINTINKNTNTVKYYNLQGQPVSHLTRGIFVKKTFFANGNVKSQKIQLK